MHHYHQHFQGGMGGINSNIHHQQNRHNHFRRKNQNNKNQTIDENLPSTLTSTESTPIKGRLTLTVLESPFSVNKRNNYNGHQSRQGLFQSPETLRRVGEECGYYVDTPPVRKNICSDTMQRGFNSNCDVQQEREEGFEEEQMRTLERPADFGQKFFTSGEIDTLPTR